jgi:hypothetical protein
MTERSSVTFIERIKSGQKLVGTVATLPCPELIEGLVKCGFDWLWIDLEHAPLSLREAQQMLQATHGRAHGLVRVPACDPVWISQVLDLGADGVIVPLVQNAADAACAVTASKYPPSGTRGVGLTRASAYGLELESYIAIANNQSAVILQVEHIDAPAEGRTAEGAATRTGRSSPRLRGVAAKALDRLVGQQSQQGHGDRRHAAAAQPAIAARPVLHAVENVEQAHDCLPVCRRARALRQGNGAVSATLRARWRTVRAATPQAVRQAQEQMQPVGPRRC